MSPRRGAAALAFAAAFGPAHAGDRPYTATTMAVVEDDDDGTIGVEVWGEAGRGAARRTQQWRAQAEYNVNPWTSLQLELGWARERSGAGVGRERSVELEFKRIWLQPARDGWGLGFAAGVEWERAVDGGWRRSAHWLYAPASWRLPDAEGWLHANLGVERRVDDATRVRWAAAAEHEVMRRTTGFVEAGGAAGAARVVHGGVRHWLRRERLALDAGIARRVERDGGVRSTQRALLIGVAVYDLGW